MDMKTNKINVTKKLYYLFKAVCSGSKKLKKNNKKTTNVGYLTINVTLKHYFERLTNLSI
jgi:hypothetical protein